MTTFYDDLDGNGFNLRMVRSYRVEEAETSRGFKRNWTHVTMDNGDEHTFSGNIVEQIKAANTAATVVPATPGYEMLEFGRHEEDGRLIHEVYRSPVVAWEILPGEGPTPVAVGEVYGSLTYVAVKRPDGRVVEAPGYEPTVYDNEENWVAAEIERIHERERWEKEKAAREKCPTPPCEAA